MFFVRFVKSVFDGIRSKIREKTSYKRAKKAEKELLQQQITDLKSKITGEQKELKTKVNSLTKIDLSSHDNSSLQTKQEDCVAIRERLEEWKEDCEKLVELQNKEKSIILPGHAGYGAEIYEKSGHEKFHNAYAKIKGKILFFEKKIAGEMDTISKKEKEQPLRILKKEIKNNIKDEEKENITKLNDIRKKIKDKVYGLPLFDERFSSMGRTLNNVNNNQRNDELIQTNIELGKIENLFIEEEKLYNKIISNRSEMLKNFNEANEVKITLPEIDKKAADIRNDWSKKLPSKSFIGRVRSFITSTLKKRQNYQFGTYQKEKGYKVTSSTPEVKALNEEIVKEKKVKKPKNKM